MRMLLWAVKLSLLMGEDKEQHDTATIEAQAPRLGAIFAMKKGAKTAPFLMICSD